MSTPADRKAKIQAAAPKQRSIIPWLAAGLVLVLLAGGVWFALSKNKDANEKVESAAANLTTPPNANKDKSGIVVNPGKATSGAPVVSLFQDYQCPACKAMEDQFGSKLEEMANAGKIQLEYHTMTFLDDNLGNDASVRSAQAAACADTVGAYAKYHDTVYANQPTQEGQGYTNDQLLKDFPKAAGITGDKLTSFTACYDKKNMANWVTTVDDTASKSNIKATPTLRVNGKDFELKNGFASLDEFEKQLLAAK